MKDKLWKIPHNEAHRFLRWGLMDNEFKLWCAWFDSRCVKYEIGGGGDRWTIYKHVLYQDVNSIRVCRCCPEDYEL